jgi:hypothetical protein
MCLFLIQYDVVGDIVRRYNLLRSFIKFDSAFDSSGGGVVDFIQDFNKVKPMDLKSIDKNMKEINKVRLQFNRNICTKIFSNFLKLIYRYF